MNQSINQIATECNTFSRATATKPLHEIFASANALKTRATIIPYLHSIRRSTQLYGFHNSRNDDESAKWGVCTRTMRRYDRELEYLGLITSINHGKGKNKRITELGIQVSDFLLDGKQFNLNIPKQWIKTSETLKKNDVSYHVSYHGPSTLYTDSENIKPVKNTYSSKARSLVDNISCNASNSNIVKFFFSTIRTTERDKLCFNVWLKRDGITVDLFLRALDIFEAYKKDNPTTEILKPLGLMRVFINECINHDRLGREITDEEMKVIKFSVEQLRLTYGDSATSEQVEMIYKNIYELVRH